jgi:hypothetical protein
MLPKGTETKIRSVTFTSHSAGYVYGFKFFDKDKKPLLDIGYTAGGSRETVMIADNEVIVGVVAKLHPSDSGHLSDFQFRIKRV